MNEGIPHRQDQRKQRGLLAEQLAARYLEEKGYTILERNWRCRYGEIDVIAQKEGALIFVEVRSRLGERYGTVLEAIDARKRHKVRMVSTFYLNRLRNPDRPIRFDAILVKWANPSSHYEMTHLEGVF